MTYNFQKALAAGETEQSIRTYLNSQGRNKEADEYFAVQKPTEVPTENGKSLGSKLKDRGTAIIEQFKPQSTGNVIEDTLRAGERGLRAAGEIAGGINDVVGAGVDKLIPEDVKKRGSELLKTQLGQDALEAVSKGAEAYNQWKAKHPELSKDFEAVVNIGGLIGQFAGSGKATDVGKKVVSTVTKDLGRDVAKQAVIQGVEAAPTALDKVGAGLKSIKDKIMGGISNVRKGATEMADTELSLKGLAPAEAKVVKMGTDPAIVQRIKTSSPEDIVAAKEMLNRQVRNTALERGVPAAKEVPGETILQFPTYAVKARKDIGAALGDVVEALPDTKLDISPQVKQISDLLQSKGIAISKKGRLFGDTVVQGDLPIYQRMWDLIKPLENVSQATPKRLDEIRRVIFKEFNLAKARTQPFSDEALKVAEKFRQVLAEPISAIDENYMKLSQAYAEITSPLEEFTKLINYKGNLDDIGEKTLKAGEVAQRVLGNAADRPTSVISDLENAVRKYGFKGKGNWQDQVWLSDLIEEIVGSTQTRSLAGGVKRGTTNAIENALGQAAQSGNILSAGIGLIRGASEPTKEEAISAIREFLDHLSKEIPK